MNTFISHGYQTCENFFDEDQCKLLLNNVLKTRDFTNLFLSEKEFKKNEEYHQGVNPRPGRNLLEKLDTSFIFLNEDFNLEMTKALGDRWRVLDYKLVMGFPKKYIPKWLSAELKDRLVSNLGAYVRPEYRDITYFQGIDFHQDIIQFPDRESDIITAYIYLDKVDENSSPLHLLSHSHKLGTSVFPHNLKEIERNKYLYKNDFNDQQNCDLIKLMGEGGTLYYWHCNTLHGTQPQIDDKPRVSVRILIEKNSKTKSDCLVDGANKISKGSLALNITRRDLDSSSKAVIFGNKINTI